MRIPRNNGKKRRQEKQAVKNYRHRSIAQNKLKLFEKLNWARVTKK